MVEKISKNMILGIIFERMTFHLTLSAFQPVGLFRSFCGCVVISTHPFTMKISNTEVVLHQARSPTRAGSTESLLSYKCYPW